MTFTIQRPAKRLLSVVGIAAGAMCLLTGHVSANRSFVIFRCAPNAIQMPTPQTRAVLTDVTVPSAIEQVLSGAGIDSVWQALPGTFQQDTTITIRTGEQVTLSNASDTYVVPAGDSVAAGTLAAALLATDGIEFAEQDADVRPDYQPWDSDVGFQWALQNNGQQVCDSFPCGNSNETYGSPGADIKAFGAFDVTMGSPQVTIGIVDFGIYASHEDLQGRVFGDYSGDYMFHGTWVAGAAAAATDNNGIGIAGVDGKALIYAAPVANAANLWIPGTDALIYQSMENVIRYGAQVINCSWALAPISSNHNVPGMYSQMVEKAFYDAYKANCVCVASMGDQGGNGGGSLTQYPAAFGREVLAVGATECHDFLWGSSSYGSHIGLVAPGVDILTTSDHNYPPYRDYYMATGTSLSPNNS